MKPVSPSERSTGSGPLRPTLTAERQARGEWSEARGRRSRRPGRNQAAGPRPHDPRSNPNAGAARPAARGTLSAEEERDLARRIQRGDSAARDRLVLANLRLVLKIARKYRCAAHSFEDLVQEGNLGLMRASQDFDPSEHATRFSSYAAIWINAFVYRAVTASSSLVRAPDHVLRLRKRLQEAIAALETGPGPDEGGPIDEAALERAAEELGVSLRRLKKCERVSVKQWTMSTAADDGAETADLAEELVDPRRPDEEAIEHEEQFLLDAALRSLNPIEAWLVRERFGLSTTIPEEHEWAGSGRDPGRSASDRRDAPARPADRAARRGYFHRSYGDLERECELGPDRLHQVERAALAKLKRVLGPFLGPTP